MEKQLIRIINQGTNENQFDYHNRRILYSNVVYLSLPLVYLVFVLLDIQSYLKPIHELKWDQFIVIIEIAICGISHYLNRIKRHNAGKMLFILTWPLLLHIIPIIYQNTPTDYYFAYPVGLIFHAALIQIMFSFTSERFTTISLMIMNFVLMLTSIHLMLLFDDEKNVSIITMVSEKYYELDIILYWLLFTLVSYFLVNAIDTLVDKLAKANEIIEGQKEELTAINEGLEAAVVERTRQIEMQNIKLRDYAFYNAHKLRGPFCRIKGLYQLKSLPSTVNSDAVLMDNYMKEAITELDVVISEIQTIVEEGKTNTL